jgi:hypothetical protein
LLRTVSSELIDDLIAGFRKLGPGLDSYEHFDGTLESTAQILYLRQLLGLGISQDPKTARSP